jgi:hypothetical protein
VQQGPAAVTLLFLYKLAQGGVGGSRGEQVAHMRHTSAHQLAQSAHQHTVLTLLSLFARCSLVLPLAILGDVLTLRRRQLAVCALDVVGI